MSENVVLFCRIDWRLKNKLYLKAEKERRSVASLVEMILKDSLGDPDTEHLEKYQQKWDGPIA